MKLELSSAQPNLSSHVVIDSQVIELLKDYTKSYTKTLIVTDKNAYSLLSDYIADYLPSKAEVIELDISEASKDLSTVNAILKELKSRSCDRKSLLVAIGGGVLCDVAGFAASSYMRGIDWVAVPTTLIAQADAAIGGKTGVNLDKYKNLVGAFWQPKVVLVDPNMLKTLPDRHLKAGLAEVIKMGIIDNPKIIELIEAEGAESALEQLIKLAAEGKVDIVSDDPKEAGERKLLNFGHTFGHAFESISFDSSNPLLHGEAISVGMVAEAKLAELEGICKPELVDRVKKVLDDNGLPTSLSGIDKEAVLRRVVLDKKNIGGETLWTLPTELGKGIYNHKASEENIILAIESVAK